MKARHGLAALCVGAALTSAQAAPSLTDARVFTNGGQVRAACRLQDGISPEMAEEIAAGLEIIIEYRLQLYRRRGGWWDDQVARKRVECLVRHDALTRQFTLTRRIDGVVVDTQATTDDAVMRAFLTSITDVALMEESRLEPGRAYYVRMRSDIGLLWRFYLIPWRDNTDWVEIPVPGTEDVPHGP